MRGNDEGRQYICGVMRKAHMAKCACMMGDEGEGVCPVVSSGVAAGVGGSGACPNHTMI